MCTEAERALALGRSVVLLAIIPILAIVSVLASHPMPTRLLIRLHLLLSRLLPVAFQDIEGRIEIHGEEEERDEELGQGDKTVESDFCAGVGSAGRGSLLVEHELVDADDCLLDLRRGDVRKCSRLERWLEG